MNNKIEVLIVDDSRIYRSLLEKALEDEIGIKIVGSVMNGVKAMEFIEKSGPPHVITLDLEMPEMDGLQTLAAVEQFNQQSSAPPIGCIMVSAFTQKGSETTLKALEAGAFDFIAKPQSENAAENQDTLKRQLTTKIKCFQSQAAVSKITTPETSRPSISPSTTTKIKAILIGCSTGGPKALMALMPELCSSTSLPIILVQHMPPKFTASLAESLDKKCSHKVLEVQGGEEIKTDHVYIAPGGRHMVLRKGASEKLFTGLNDQPPENGCRPAVDVLFRSAASLFDGNVIAVVLTGMGSDGTKGLGPLQRSGAHIIVQDEESSVVWGMPGSAVEAGRVHEILPLEQIASAIAKKTS